MNGSFRPWTYLAVPGREHINFTPAFISLLFLFSFHNKNFCFKLKIKEKLTYFQFNGKENYFSFWFDNWLSFVIVEDYHLCIYSNFEGLRNIPFRNSFVLNCLGIFTFSLVFFYISWLSLCVGYLIDNVYISLALYFWHVFWHTVFSIYFLASTFWNHSISKFISKLLGHIHFLLSFFLYFMTFFVCWLLDR